MNTNNNRPEQILETGVFPNCQELKLNALQTRKYKLPLGSAFHRRTVSNCVNYRIQR